MTVSRTDAYPQPVTSHAQTVLKDVLGLSEKDRARIAVELLASFDGPPDADAGEGWAEEVERRARKVIAGESKTHAWSTVRARLTKRVR